MKQNKLIYIYFAILAIQLTGDYLFDLNGSALGVWLTKPLLMPILAYWYYQNTKAKTSFDKIILVSLFFSWWGDNFLMPGIFKTDINFLLGLASFLIAHVLYIVAFVKTPIKTKSVLLKRPWLVFPFVLFLFGMISFLFNQKHPDFALMSIPVIVYATVIMIMVLTALNRYEKVNHPSFKWVFIGAVLFMISDSVIAFQNFSYLFGENKLIARFLIMPLYVLGQYFIAKGCILQNANGNNQI